MIAPRLARSTRTLGQQVRLNSTASSSSSGASTLPIPPKIATPKSLQGPGGNSARMDEVVGFYKSLPKGTTTLKKGPFANPGNGKPLVVAMASLFLIGYTMDYNMHLSE